MFARLIHKSLDTDVAPMIYIMMGVSMMIGFFFATGLWVGPGESVLYTIGVLIPKEMWGATLLTTATVAQVGLIIGNERLISIGGIGGFMSWLFASISLFMAGQHYILSTVALLHLLFHGYVVLAASLGYIRRKRM